MSVKKQHLICCEAVMLEHEWRELEVLCERVSDLRHRQSHAMRSRNVGLMEGLKQEVVRARRQREQLVRYISARLGAVTAERAQSARPEQRPPAHGGPAHAAIAASDGEPIETSVDIIGL